MSVPHNDVYAELDVIGRTVLRFTLDAIELRQRVREAIDADAAMLLGPDKLRLLLGEPDIS